MTQFPSLTSALCATLLCAGTVAVHAEDNAAQAAARAELLQELQVSPAPQTNNTSIPPLTPAPAVATTAVVTAPAAPPAAQTPAAPAETAPSAVGADNPEQAASRALLLQELSTIPANSNSPASTSVAAPAPAAAAIAATTGADAAVQAKAAALAEASVQTTVATPAAVATPPPVAPKTSTAVVTNPKFSVPAPPISTDQATRLQALDAKYTADQISPADYFAQREAILNGQ